LPPNQAQVDQAQAALWFAAAGSAVRALGQTGYGTVQNEQQYTSQLHQQQAGSECRGDLKLAASGNRGAQAQRNSAVASLRQPKRSATQAESICPTRRDGGAAGTRRPSDRPQSVNSHSLHEPDDVCAGSDLGHGKLQGDSTRPHAAR